VGAGILEDEAEFEALAGCALIDREIAGLVRDAVAEVLRKIESQNAPFDEAWTKWRPDPLWPVP